MCITRTLGLLFLLLPFIALSASEEDLNSESLDNSIRFSENKGQWNNNVLFRLRFKTGALFLEKDKFTYNFIDAGAWEKLYNIHHGNPVPNNDFILKGHAFKVYFKNSNPNATVRGKDEYPDYENYFIGNDPLKWASHVTAFSKADYHEIYPGIDLSLLGKKGHLKYTFTIQPGAKTSDILIEFEGIEDIFLENGQLHYTTSVNSIYEEAPYSYQVINGKKIEVPSKFILNENKVSFDFPNGYDHNFPLIIDPVLVFATYTGSLADNFGYTATYDQNGNFYAGGIARAAGYPTTTGAFQTNFAGGSVVGNFELGYDADIAITKFNSQGNALLYSTYLGGATNEQPHSLVVNSNDELIIYGRTNSSNFPISTGAFDVTYNGGTDIIVTKFNSTGTALMGSTFIGGTGDDGANISPAPYVYSTLKFNYADDARGEVIVDDQNNIYIASCTRSINFPASPGAFQTSLSGSQDGCIIKLNRDLTSRIWATYLGGSGDDAAYSLVLDDQGRIYTCGGTSSPNFPTTSGSLITAAPGGQADGFVAHFSSNGSSLVQSTYIGTSNYDQTFLVQLDGDNNVYTVGQTSGAFPVTGGVYSNPNSGQFIMGLTPDLSTTRFSTVFGKGDMNPDISLTAFLVDNCRNIYVSGWGGATNNTVGTTYNLPVTSDAYQSHTDGSDFYFLVLSRDAGSLLYATFFGGPLSHEHVDGGTSRFDKNGVIYQAVCAGCGGYNDFPTTPGAWSNTNKSQSPVRNCNLGAAKFEFQLIGVDVSVVPDPASSGCVPFTVNFDNTFINAKDFFWDFGDGATSTDTFPTHTFTNTGNFTVTLIGVDSTTCDNVIFSDTAQLVIHVDDDSLHADFITSVVSNCDSFVVDFISTSTSVNNIDNFHWDFGDGGGSTLINPHHEFVDPGTYNVTLVVSSSQSCNPFDTIIKPITLSPFITAAISIDDTFGCQPFTVNFTDNSTGGILYNWDFGDGNTSSLRNPQHIYVDTGTFMISLIIIDPASCNRSDTAFAQVLVSKDSVFADFIMDTLANTCDSLLIRFNNLSVNYNSLQWDFGDGSTSSLENPTHLYSNADSFWITLTAFNTLKCNNQDTAQALLILSDKVEALFDVPEGCPPLDVTPANNSYNAVSYLWQFSESGSTNEETPTYFDLESGMYSLTLTAYNPQTCNDSDTYIQTFSVYDQPIAYFATDSDVYQLYSDIVFHNQSINASHYLWSFDDGDSSTAENPTHAYRDLSEYGPCLTAISNFGCDSTYCKKLSIDFHAVIDVPNAFSPNRDGMNDILYVKGLGVAQIEFKIYNRWGELVFETDDPGIVCNHPMDCFPSKGWDGTCKGTDQEMDVYIYTLKAAFQDGSETGLKKGNITLLR